MINVAQPIMTNKIRETMIPADIPMDLAAVDLLTPLIVAGTNGSTQQHIVIYQLATVITHLNTMAEMITHCT